MPKKRIIAGLLVIAALGSGAADSDPPSSQEHGKYLVHHVAMCIYCHTPKTDSGALKTEELLSGARMPVASPYADQTWGFRAPDLRSIPSRWGKDAFVKFLETGRTPTDQEPRPPMPPFRMTHEDAMAVAEYLDSLPPQ